MLHIIIRRDKEYYHHKCCILSGDRFISIGIFNGRGKERFIKDLDHVPDHCSRNVSDLNHCNHPLHTPFLIMIDHLIKDLIVPLFGPLHF